MLGDRLDERRERVVFPEYAGLNGLKDGVQLGRLLLDRDGVVPVGPSLCLDIRGEEAKEEHVVFPDLLRNLDVGSVDL